MRYFVKIVKLFVVISLISSGHSALADCADKDECITFESTDLSDLVSQGFEFGSVSAPTGNFIERHENGVRTLVVEDRAEFRAAGRLFDMSSASEDIVEIGFDAFIELDPMDGVPGTRLRFNPLGDFQLGMLFYSLADSDQTGSGIYGGIRISVGTDVNQRLYSRIRPDDLNWEENRLYRISYIVEPASRLLNVYVDGELRFTYDYAFDLGDSIPEDGEYRLVPSLIWNADAPLDIKLQSIFVEWSGDEAPAYVLSIDDEFLPHTHNDTSGKFATVDTPVGFRVTPQLELEDSWTIYTGEAQPDGEAVKIIGTGPLELTLRRHDYIDQNIYNARLHVNGQEQDEVLAVDIRCWGTGEIQANAGQSADDCDGDGLKNRWEINGGIYYYQHPVTLAYQTVPLRLDMLDVRTRDILVEVSYLQSDVEWTVDELNLELALTRVTELFDDKGLNLVFLDKGKETFDASVVSSPCVNYSPREQNTAADCLENSLLKAYRAIYGVDDPSEPKGGGLPDAVFCNGLWGDAAMRAAAASESRCRSLRNAHLDTRRHMVIAPDDIWSEDLWNNPRDPSGMAVLGYGFVVANGFADEYLSFRIDKLEATILHELGHALGLGHGGGDSLNCKPNYLSVMNYLFQLNTSNRPIDLSHSRLATVDPQSFDETEGLTPAAGDIGSYVDGRYFFRFCPLCLNEFGGEGKHVQRTSAATVPLDYNRNFIFQQQANIELADKALANCDPAAYSGDDILAGYNDWGNLSLDVHQASTRLLSLLSDADDSGMNADTFMQFENQSLLFDEDDDGIAGTDDNCPYLANPSQADGDGDGIGSACDVCPDVADQDQLDADNDGIGDACDLLTGARDLLLPVGEWVQLGLPLDTGLRTLAQIIGTALPLDQYLTHWVVYQYSGETRSYRLMELNDTFEAATAYWILQDTGASVPLSLSAALSEPDALELPECVTTVACVYRTLSSGSQASQMQWDMVSSGMSTPVSISGLGLSFAKDGRIVHAAIDSDQSLATVTPVYIYSNGRYQALSSNDELQDWQGGWVGIASKQATGGFGLTVSR